MKIYIAGKYSGNDIIEILNNIREGIKVSAKILKDGNVPFCPWLDYQFQFFEPSLKIDDYYRYCISWLEVSDAILVLPNSENSKGTQAEIKRATELGIPIYHNLEEIHGT